MSDAFLFVQARTYRFSIMPSVVKTTIPKKIAYIIAIGKIVTDKIRPITLIATSMNTDRLLTSYSHPKLIPGLAVFNVFEMARLLNVTAKITMPYSAWAVELLKFDATKLVV